MDQSLEENLLKAIRNDDESYISQLLSQGANPNKTVSHGKTCLGEAAFLGNIGVVKLLIEASKTYTSTNNTRKTTNRKCHSKSYKRKLQNEGSNLKPLVKCKNSEKSCENKKGNYDKNSVSEEGGNLNKNQGYYVFIHSESSSSGEVRIPNLKCSSSPSPLTPSPQDLEWDEEILNVAPTTSEDEAWSSMYKWYAAILESTGAAIASSSMITYGINQQDSYMKTALHYAAIQGHAEVVQMLIDAGCKVDSTAGDGLTPLHIAVIRNHKDIVRILLNSGSHVNYKTHEKMTPLHFAASRGYLDLVKILVEKGAYVDARDTNERTALYLAAGRGHVNVVQFLIASGANVNGEEIHGYTALCEAVWKRYPDVVQMLLASGARVTHAHKLLHNAILQRQVPILQMLVDINEGLNLHDDNGDTPLVLATRMAQTDAVRLLLTRGANVNSCNNVTGSNALHIAVECIEDNGKFEELLICLLEHKIDLNAVALTGDTALNLALLLQKDYAAMLLIRYGADVNACDLLSYGIDNLSLACRSSISLANILLKAGHRRKIPDTKTLSNSSIVTNWLYWTCRQPFSLSDLCRIRIRNLLKHTTLYKSVEALQLPSSIKRYLMMEDLQLDDGKTNTTHS